MFKKLNGQGAASDDGFVVQFESRFALRYEDAERCIVLTVEDGADTNGHFVFIYPPKDVASAEIIDRVGAALRFLRVRYRVAA